MVVQGGFAHLLSSTFANNEAVIDHAGGLDYFPGAAAISVDNSVFHGNTGHYGDDRDQLRVPLTVSVRTSCLEGPLSSYSGQGNLDPDGDPFVGSSIGDLRLESGTLCVDAGNPFVDFDPTQDGFQLPPDGDLDGKDRIVDGDGDGTPVIDMGAYEYQGG
jgi:hypothetical protein